MLILPKPPNAYNRIVEERRNQYIAQADNQNWKRNTDIELAATRLIIRSPGGMRFALTVDDAGNLSTTPM